MLTPALVNIVSFFYPIGNTPAVSLTQSIPPDASADILLLGCGDVRNILFTNHINNRKMDITCCDNQKAVIARNILILSLIIDDDDNENGDFIWSIYYHMYLDEKALGLLRSQVKKLHELSSTMDTWRQGKYGSLLTFCDSATLADVREMWAFYSMERRGVELLRFKRRFESVLEEAKAKKGQMQSVNIRSAMPVHNGALEDLSTLHDHFWKHGSTELNANIRASEKHPNPTFLSGENGAPVHYGTDPLHGFHLAAAFAPLRSDDAAFDQINKLPRLERVVAVARMEFREWIASYRSRIAMVRVRFSVGDAISLAYTLQHKRATASSTAHWYRDRYGFRPLELDGPDYTSSLAPLDFDVIDTSNLCDHLGSLVLLTAISPLLRNNASSVLYTEVLVKHHKTYQEALNNVLCGDVPSLSALLDLLPVEYWTNTSTSSAVADERFYDMFMDAAAKSNGENIGGMGGQMYLRTCWKRSIYTTPLMKACPRPTVIRFNADSLAKVLYQVYAYMFRDEDYAYKFDRIMNLEALRMSWLIWYNRASFASFLRLVKTRVACDWDEAMEKLLMLIMNRSNAPMGMQYYQELHIYMHMMDIFSTDFYRHRQDARPIGMSAFAPSRITPVNEKWGDLRDWENIPSVVCITLKIPRSKLAVFTNTSRQQLGTPHVHCFLQGARSGSWQNIFMACQLAFGDVSTRGEPHDDSFEVSVIEDDAGWSGNSALIAVFYAPTPFLLEPEDVMVVFGIHTTPATVALFAPKLGLALNVYQTTLDNSTAVYITRYGPNQTQFPVTTGFSQVDSVRPNDRADFSLIADVGPGTGNIATFTGRLDILADAHKQALKDGCPVQMSTVSPCEVAIRLGQTEPLSLSFPVFVEEASRRLRIARKSAYIEVIARVTGPFGWMEYPQYMHPTDLQQGKPINWNVPYLELRTCTIINVDQRSKLSWLTSHVSLMMSNRERALRDGKRAGLVSSAGELVRLDFKESLFSLFTLFSGLEGSRHQIFGLSNPANASIHLVVLPSTLRLNLADRAVVLDCAVLPLHSKVMPSLLRFLPTLLSPPSNSISIHVSDKELQLWRRALPAYVERCRTWSHREDCEYVTKGAIPLTTENNEQFLCTCGNGQFPPNFITNVPYWKELAKYAVRAAISPAFWAPFSDDAYRPDQMADIVLNAQDVFLGKKCTNCGKDKQADGGSLLSCGRCMKAKYCSRSCQRADWREHKRFCKEK
ncbi:hypothetical protein F4861DRAFT_541599 [Xylaria intraflava]|nr:hypothetical protein F4861DRAFT_541599 [Xylaria intraflava]